MCIVPNYFFIIVLVSARDFVRVFYSIGNIINRGYFYAIFTPFLSYHDQNYQILKIYLFLF